MILGFRAWCFLFYLGGRLHITISQVLKERNMTQVEFATAFGISINTLRHWERGDRTPQGAARVLLHVVAKEPQAVLRALAH